MGSFLLNNLELIVAVVCSACIPIYCLARNKSDSKNSNDLTRLIIKNKKINESITKQSKSLF